MNVVLFREHLQILSCLTHVRDFSNLITRPISGKG